MKIVFMGTPDFAVPVFEKLVQNHDVVCVYTRAPKEAGRGHELKQSPVHVAALKHGIEVRTPKNFKDEAEVQAFAALQADVAVVAAYGVILPGTVIKAFQRGCLNVHASLLPRWRGAAPIQRAIEAGDEFSGVTIMEIVEALDAGRMYQKGSVPITSDMTGGKLHDALSVLGADLMLDVLNRLDEITPAAQDETLVTYAQKLEKTEEKLDFSQPADVLERKIRAFNPYPATYFEYHGERFKVLEAKIFDAHGSPDEILEGEKALVIATGDKALEVLQIQRQNKRLMPIRELLRGMNFVKKTIV
ncbi:MAG: methionyl-tRNA formyltransferase [Alphaproteobacteria bacterium]|nr:methionyl-tRNA formyltransferase [Alphaproteobacteria bacterium]